MSNMNFPRYCIVMVVLCLVGLAVYSLRGSHSQVGVPETPAPSGTSDADPGPPEGGSVREEWKPVHEVEDSGTPNRVKLVDNDAARPLAGFVVTAPSLGSLETGADGRIELHRGLQYRFTSHEYGAGVIRMPEGGELPTLVRIRPLYVVSLTMSESAATPPDGLLVALQFVGQRLPYVFQIREYSVRLRAGETAQLRVPRGRWRVGAESEGRVRPHVIDTSRSSEFELSLVDRGQRSIGGQVLTVAGRPCSGATVQVLGRVSHASTDEEGRFLIPDCPPVLSLQVIPGDQRFEPLLRAGPFKAGREDLILTVQNAHANRLTVKSGNVALVPDAIKVHRGRIVTDCPVSAEGVATLPRMLSSGDAIEIHHSSLASPLFCNEWTEECNEAAGERSYLVNLFERDISMRIYDAGSYAPVSGCRVTLLSSPNGLVAEAAGASAVEFTADLRRSVVHGAYKADVDGVVTLLGVASGSMYAVCRSDGFNDERVVINSGDSNLWVPMHRTARIEGRVLTGPDVKGWPCGVRLVPVDGGAVTEVLAKQGRFEMRVRSGRYCVGVRLGPSLSQLALIDKGVRDIHADAEFDIDVRDVEPVRLRFTLDPQCVRGAVLGDSVTVQGGSGLAPVIRVNNGGGEPEPVLVFPGEYYVWISGVADDTGERIVGGKQVTVHAGAGEMNVPIGFTGRKMLLGAPVPAKHAHETFVRLPDWSYVQLDARGEAVLLQELPEGSPVQLFRNVGGRWESISDPLRLRLEGEAGGCVVGRAFR